MSVNMSGLGAVGLGVGVGSYQPGVYVPLKALFLVFQWIFFILAGNKDNYNISDGFEFQLDPTSDCGVTCP